jgi:hypothetical protein
VNTTTHSNTFQVPAAMAGASSGVGRGESFSNSKAAKMKKQLGGDEAATAIRPRPWTAGVIHG